MTAIAKSSPLNQVSMGAPTALQVPVAASTTVYMGQMVSLVTATGGASVPAYSTTGAVLGVAEASADNSTGSLGDVSVNLLEGSFWFPNFATRPVVATDIGKAVYASDNHTISRTNTDGPLAGVALAIDSDLGVLVYVNAESNYLLSQATLTQDLASILNGKGASLIGLEDAGSFTTAATVEAALAEIYQNAKSAIVSMPILICSSILAAGTPMAAFADNASSNPGITLVDSKDVGIRWNNNASQTAIYTSFVYPADIDVTANASIVVNASKVGATIGDATTFTIALFNQAVGALHDADTDYGGATSAMTGNATSKTVQSVSRTITAADMPTAGQSATFSIKPTDSTLGTDDVIVTSVKLVYKRKVLTS